MSLLHRIRIVLHEPQDPVNIGATVRVMKNMGVRDLVLVRPMRYDTAKLERIAHNTRELADRIRHEDGLAPAISDCVAVYAFAGKHRGARWPVVTPRQMAMQALAQCEVGPVALLFGREDHGLPNDALDQSTAMVTIPTTEHMSLNLAQAVLVGCYELHLAAGDVTRRAAAPRGDAPPATIEQREQTMQRVERALTLLDFFKTRSPENVLRTLRSLLGRAEPTGREIELLKAMAIEVDRTLEREVAKARAAGASSAPAVTAGASHAAEAEASPAASVPVPSSAARSWRERATAVIPGGTSTGSKRPHTMYGPYSMDPAHALEAVGCRVRDADGIWRIDLTGSLGAVAIGYADPAITQAAQAAAARGPVLPLPDVQEVTLAERLVATIPCAEQVRFLKSGAEACAAAVRIARAATGRSLVLGSGYFGWLDWWTDAPGVPAGAVADFTAVPFNDREAWRAALRRAGDTLAACIVEPVVESLADVEWLRDLRAHCEAVGAVLIFDEIKTGFRLHAGGAQALLGVTPDLATLGKAMANGYPLAAVVGRQSVMRAAADTWISSTLAAEGVALAAAHAVLDRHERAPVAETLARIGAEIRRGIAAAAGAGGLPVTTRGHDAMFIIDWPGETMRDTKLQWLRRHGVLAKRGPYQFPMLAHDARALARIAHAFHETLAHP